MPVSDFLDPYVEVMCVPMMLKSSVFRADTLKSLEKS